MNIEISKGIHTYEVNLEQISQWCGQNIDTKGYCIDSLDYYFSTHKYDESEAVMQDNVLIEGEALGRKYFSVIRISHRSQLLSFIQFSKNGKLTNLIHERLTSIEMQRELLEIEERINSVMKFLNDNLFSDIGNISVRCEATEIWDIVQKSELVRDDGSSVKCSTNYELIADMLDILKDNQAIASEKMLVIFEDIDHLISVSEYEKIVRKVTEISRKSDIWFLFATSLDGFCKITKENITGVTIFGDDLEIGLSECEHLKEYINDRWPYNHGFDDEEIIKIIERIVQKIGKNNNLIDLQDLVLLKMFDKENMTDFEPIGEVKTAELQYLQEV